MTTENAKTMAPNNAATRKSLMPNPFSWSLDGWFLFLQIASFAILGATVAVGYFLSKNQAKEIIELKTGLAGAKKAQAEAERQLEIVKQKQGPRGIDREAFLLALKGRPKGSVLLRYIGDSSEVFGLATNLHSLIKEAGWEIDDLQQVSSLGDVAKSNWVLAEITLVSKYANGVTDPSLKLEDGQAMSRALAAGIPTAGVGAVMERTLPDSKLRIIVGPKF